MKTMQRSGTCLWNLRCIVVFRRFFVAIAAISVADVAAKDPPKSTKPVGEWAEINVDEYVPPRSEQLLQPEGLEKAEALAYYHLALRHESDGKIIAAIESLERVMELSPKQVPLADKTAELLHRSGRTKKALELLRSTQKANPNSLQALLQLSRFLATRQRSNAAAQAEAIFLGERAVKTYPLEPEAYEHLISLHALAKDRAAAARVLETALEQESRSSEYWLAIGQMTARFWGNEIHSDRGKRALLNEVHDRARFFDQKNPRVIEQVGDYYHATKQYSQAAQAFRQAIGIEPDNLSLRRKLASVYEMAGDKEKQIETLEEMITISPRDVSLRRLVAEVYLKDERFDYAVRHMRAALSLEKGQEKAYINLAQLMLQKGLPVKDAVELLEDGIFHYPDSLQLQMLLTFAYPGAQRWDDAIMAFKITEKMAMNEQPEALDQEFYFRFAAAYERGRKFDEAEKLFRKTIEILGENDPQGEDAKFAARTYNYLGYMWLEQGKNIDEAGELIKLAADFDPENGAIIDSLGWFHFLKGNYNLALENLLKAEKLIQQVDPVIFDHIAQAHAALGNHKEAISYIRKALEVEADGENAETYAARLEDYEAALGKKAQKEEAEEPASPSE